jgi:hypothetical protein
MFFKKKRYHVNIAVFLVKKKVKNVGVGIKI